MDEHVFARSGDRQRDDDLATQCVAELTEAILDEVSRVRHRWETIAHMAAELARVAALMADEREPPMSRPRA